MATASFSRKSQREPVFTQKIKKLYWTIKDFGNGPSLTLNLDREGSQYTQYLSGGKANGAKPIKDGTELDVPKDWALPSNCQAARMLNTLMDACDEAGVSYNTDSLKCFWGMTCQWVNEPRPTKANPNKSIPVVKAVEAPQNPKENAQDSENQNELAKQVLQAMLEDGEVDLEEIDSKRLKNYTNGADFSKRKALADLLSDPDFVSQLGFTVKGNTVTQ